MHESIELQMSLLLFVSLAGYILATWINQSAVVGAILEGVHLKNAKVFHEGADYLRIIFAAIFFVSFGVFRKNPLMMK